MALLITITDAGRAEIINADNTGTGPVVITEIGFGTGQYAPSKTQTALTNEVKRVGSIAGLAVAADTIHVMAKDEGPAAYNVGEFGLYSASGTLVAVYSQTAAAGWIIQKAGASTLLLAVDIILESLDAASLSFGDITFLNPPATTETPGVVQLENSLTSSSTTKALTAAQGKKLQDEKEPAFAAGTTAQYRRGDKTWQDLAAAVRAVVMTGLSTATSTAVAAADSLLVAIGKLQAQVTGLNNTKLDATANAVSASKLATARTINGVNFDGTANITVVDATKLPLTGGTIAKAGQVGFGTAALNVNSSGVAGQNAVLGFASAAGGAAIVLDDGVNGLRIESTTPGVLANLRVANLYANGELVPTSGVAFNAPDLGASWARGLVYRNGAAYLGGIGGLGNASALSNLYMALGATPWVSGNGLRVNANGIQVEGPVNLTGSGKIAPQSTAERQAGMYGLYDPAKIGHVWSMGASFVIPADGADFGNLYGIAYKHTNNPTGGSMAGGHQMVFCAAGVPNAAIGLAGGIWTSGIFTGNGSGLTTLNASNLASGTVPDARLSGTYTGVNITGNAATATALQTARTINGVSFNGTANITVADATKLPLSGGTLTGNLNQTSGTSIVNALTANGKQWLIVNNTSTFSIREDGTALSRFTISEGGQLNGDGGGFTGLNASYLASGTVPDARLSGTYTGVSITGNAATATALQTARTINGVSFNGTANITVADATKLPLTGGTVTGAVVHSHPTATQYVSDQWKKNGVIRAAMGNEPNGSWNVWTYNSSGVFQASLNFSEAGVLTAPNFSGGGFNLTGLDANKILFGTVPLARLPGDVQNLAVGSSTQDPDLAVSPVILTNHPNSPGGGIYWHITTTFFSAISTAANRAQVAVSYNGGFAQVFARHFFSSAWTDWSRCDNSESSPPGLIAPFAQSTAPSGWLKANGAAVSRSTYAALFAAIGTTFGAGNGSTTFNLPDLRGEFLRGWDDARGVDSGRAFGSAQSELTRYSRLTQVRQTGAAAAATRAVPEDGESLGVHVDGYSISGPYGLQFTNTLQGTETRPRNVALLACIKY